MSKYRQKMSAAKYFINECERNTDLDGDIYKFRKIKYKFIGQHISAEFGKDKTILHKKASQTL